MSRGEPYQFERFVWAVHRRMVVLRGLERVGLSLLVGCGALLMLVPVLMWRGESSGLLVSVVLGVAALAGAGWGVVGRPGRLAAAAEADRQLRLADLLGTAWLVRDSAGGSDGFTSAVLALAEARCRGLSPSAVVLNRWGARGWGGIGLAVALVVGLSLMGPDDRGSEARATTSGATRSWRDTEGRDERSVGGAWRPTAAPDYRRAKPGTGGDDADPLKSAVSTAETKNEPGGVAKEGTSSEPGGAADGTGGGAGRSTAKENSASAQSPTARGMGEKGNAAQSASGGGGEARQSGGGDVTASGGGTSGGDAARTARKPAPVWRGEGWAADREAARAAVRTGAVPAAYRDLVRDYFERP